MKTSSSAWIWLWLRLVLGCVALYYGNVLALLGLILWTALDCAVMLQKKS